jgi:hypothetical protein
VGIVVQKTASGGANYTEKPHKKKYMNEDEDLA